MEKPTQKRLMVADGVQLLDDPCVELLGIVGGEVTQPAVLQPTPQRFHGHQIPGMRRQRLQLQPALRVADCIVDRASLMHTTPVPDDDHRTAQARHGAAQELRYVLVVKVAVDQRLECQSQPVTPGWQPQGGCHRHLLPMVRLLLQQRWLATPRPATPYQRSHQQSAFVQQHNRGAAPKGLFLMRGQSWARHRAMASASRSRWPRRGFGGVKPRCRNQRVRESGCKEIPHSCSINCASRGALHSSVAKPYAVGRSASQRRTILSWAGDSLGGRPLAGCAAKPVVPCWRQVASQRRTLRASTPKKSAISWVEYPSRARWTARQRRASNTAGEPLVLIREHRANLTPCGHYFCRNR